MKDTVKGLSIDKGNYGNGGWRCHKCSCGNEFCFLRDFESEQADSLRLSGATELDHPVKVIRFSEDDVRVVGCQCWFDQAKELAGLDSSSDPQQAIYNRLKHSEQKVDEIALAD